MKELLDKISNNEEISFWVLDETGKNLESNNFYTWSLIGDPTPIEKNGLHKGIGIIGATEISKEYEFIYNDYEKGTGGINADRVIKFVNDILEHDRELGKKQTIIQWDNARIHKNKKVKQFVEEHKDELIIINQPTYSPDLNPQEEMWKWLKSKISRAKQVINVEVLHDMISDFKAYLDMNKDKVKKRLNWESWFK